MADDVVAVRGKFSEVPHVFVDPTPEGRVSVTADRKACSPATGEALRLANETSNWGAALHAQ
jgi:hypothetical protein